MSELFPKTFENVKKMPPMTIFLSTVLNCYLTGQILYNVVYLALLNGHFDIFILFFANKCNVKRRQSLISTIQLKFKFKLEKVASFLSF
jgi:hypothetical protein